MLTAIATFERVREGPNWREADAIRDYASLLYDEQDVDGAIVHFENALGIVDELPADSAVRMRVTILSRASDTSCDPHSSPGALFPVEPRHLVLTRRHAGVRR